MKKLISRITALALACAGLGAMNTSAIPRPFDESLTGQYEGFELLYSRTNPNNGMDGAVYVKKNGEFKDYRSSYRFIDVYYIKNRLEITIADKGSNIAKAKEIFEKNGAVELYAYLTSSDNGPVYKYQMRFPNDDVALRSLYSELSEIADIREFMYYEKQGIASGDGYFLFDSPTYYYLNDAEIEEMANYIKEKELDFTVRKLENPSTVKSERYNVYLDPNYDIDPDEHIQVGVEIFQDLGYSMQIIFQSSTSPMGSSSPIDVLNAVDGDANCDGQLTIADAAAVMQSLGNADKYGLSAQGRFNADLDSNGISTTDAMTIQKLAVNAN